MTGPDLSADDSVTEYPTVSALLAAAHTAGLLSDLEVLREQSATCREPQTL